MIARAFLGFTGVAFVAGIGVDHFYTQIQNFNHQQKDIETKLRASRRFLDRHPEIDPKEVFELTGLNTIPNIETRYQRISE